MQSDESKLKERARARSLAKRTIVARSSTYPKGNSVRPRARRNRPSVQFRKLCMYSPANVQANNARRREAREGRSPMKSRRGRVRNHRTRCASLTLTPCAVTFALKGPPNLRSSPAVYRFFSAKLLITARDYGCFYVARYMTETMKKMSVSANNNCLGVYHRAGRCPSRSIATQ